MVAALLVPESELVIQGVGLNPTRSALLDFLISIGAAIKVLDVSADGGAGWAIFAFRARPSAAASSRRK